MNEIIKMLRDAAIATLYPNYSRNKDEDCIVYSYSVVSANKVTKRSRLQLTLICGSIKTCDEYEKAVNDLILTFADEPLTRNVIQVECNGGGSLYDEARNKEHRILYYDIIERYEPLK